MSSRSALDPATAGRIAALDPVLRQVARTSRSGPVPEPYEIHDVSWTPGRECSLVYRVPSAPAHARFVAVRLGADGVSRHELDADPGLPGVRDALDVDRVRDLVGRAAGETVRDLEVDPVRYRPGSRCVLRYTTRLAGGRSHSWYAKVFPVDAFSRLAPLAQSLAGSPDPAALLPRLAAVWPDAQTLLYDAASGPSLSSLLADPDLSPVRRARLTRRLGTLLAALHECHNVSAPPWSTDDQIGSIRHAMTATVAADPGLARTVLGLLTELESLVPPETAAVLSHGSLRPGHVILCGDQRLVFVDIDAVCLTDRARDLGTGLAQLFWLRLRRPAASVVLRAGETAMLAGYEQGAPAVHPASLLWWRAAALLQIAVRRYRRMEADAWPLVPALVDSASDAVAALASQAASRLREDLLDRESMATLLGAALVNRTSSTRTVRIESAETMSVAPARRTVVRYRVRGLEDDGPVTVVGKAFEQPSRARLLHAHLDRLYGGPLGQGLLRVPEPFGMVPGQPLVFYRHCEGQPLADITDPSRVHEGVRSAARWLATLHTSDVTFERALSLTREAETTQGWAERIAETLPGLGAAAAALASGWVAAAQETGSDPEVPIHKDFHAGHVLVGAETSVVDLDEARMGDPTFDLAHFCVYLSTTHGIRSSLTDTFIDEYSSLTGWRDPGSFGPFSAYTWLKIARQRAVGSGPFSGVPAEQRGSAVAEALAEGERCLNR